MTTRSRALSLVIGILALTACSDDDANRPYLDIGPATKVALDPDGARVEHRQLVASAGAAVPAQPSAPLTLGAGKSATAPTPLAATDSHAPLPVVAVGSTPQPKPAAASDEPLAPDPTKHQWRTSEGITLREQLRLWVKETNGEYVLEEPGPTDRGDPPWVMTAADSYTGDFLHALGWLKAGFWDAPEPWFVVSSNNHVLLRTLGNQP